MPATRFDGAGDIITVGPGSGVITAGHTLILVERRNVINAWHAGISAEGATTGAVRASFETSNLNGLSWGSTAGGGAGSGTTVVPDATDSAASPYQWYGMGAAKQDGTGQVLFARRNLTANTAIGSESVSASAAVSASAHTRYCFGLWDGTDDFDGWKACAAIFNGVLTLSQLTECFANRRTSDIWNCSFGRPSGLWEFNIAAASIVDLTGNGANYVSNVGTSLDAAETPDWTFDGLGAAAPSAGIWVPRRMPLGV